MKDVLQFINEAAVSCAIISFVAISISNFVHGKRPKLEELLASGLAASAIPTGLALLLCAFKPNLLQQMSGFNIHIATAGCALIFISIKGIATVLTQTNSKNGK